MAAGQLTEGALGRKLGGWGLARPPSRRLRGAPPPPSSSRRVRIFGVELEAGGVEPYVAPRRVLLRLASEAQIPGTLIISIGSCPWPEPWFRTHGAHLVIQVRGD